MIVQTSFTFRFADVEVCEPDFRVIRSGESLAIEPKAFRVLIYLLRHAGHLVPKEELIRAVWGDTAVTDNSLTRAIALLRRLLDDDPRQPRFIETVSTAGYRFICPVENGLAEAPASDSNGLDSTKAAPVETPIEDRRTRKKLWIALTAAAVVLSGAAGLTWYAHLPLPALRISSYTEIASVGQWFGITATDGSNLYVNLLLPNSNAVVPVSSGQMTPLSIDLPTSKDSPNDAPFINGASPDGSMLLVTGKMDPMLGRELWTVDVHGRGARYLAAKCDDATFSPDGRTVLFSTLLGDLYTVPSTGGKPRLLHAFPAPAATGLFAWSPDGSRIRFTRAERLWEIAADGSNPHEVLPNWNPEFAMFSRGWTPDGEVFLFVAQNRWRSNNLAEARQLWALDERHGWLRHASPEPVQLTSGAIIWSLSILSKDGKTVYGSGMIPKGELVGYNAATKQLLPYLGGISAEYVNFSKDGKYLVYVTYPDGTMWRAERDGSGLQQLTSPPIYPLDPKWSPDGTQILYFDLRGYIRGEMYTIPSHGGMPTRLLPGDEHWNGYPDWSPDGRKIVFDQSPAGIGAMVRLSQGSKGRILELDTGKISDLPPCPKPCYFPRWSPDGRYLLKLAVDHKNIMLLDLETNQWSTLSPASGAIEYPHWSRDGRAIYFQDGDFRGLYKSTQPGIYRLLLTGGKTERVVDLKGFKGCGSQELVWSGLDPEDVPLLLRDAGTYDIYALTLERK